MDLDEEWEIFCKIYDEDNNHIDNQNKYKIQHYTYHQAENHNLLVYPSVNLKKKIDVYDRDGIKYICSCGDIRYLDYPTYLEKYGEQYANTKRQLHNIQLQRKQNKHKNYSALYYENLLLW